MAGIDAAPSPAPGPRPIDAMRAWLQERLQAELQAEPEAQQVWLERVQRLDALAEQLEQEPNPMRRLHLLRPLLIGWVELCVDARQALPGPPAPPPLFPKPRPQSEGKSALAILQRLLGGPTPLTTLVSDELVRLGGVKLAAEVVLDSTRDVDLARAFEILDAVSPEVRASVWDLSRP